MSAHVSENHEVASRSAYWKEQEDPENMLEVSVVWLRNKGRAVPEPTSQGVNGAPNSGSGPFPVEPAQGSCKYLPAPVVFLLPTATWSPWTCRPGSSPAEPGRVHCPSWTLPGCPPPSMLAAQSMNMLFDVGWC